MAYKNDGSIQKILEKTDAGEPIFLIVGRDLFSADTVFDWVNRAIDHGGVPQAKINEAAECALEMMKFRPKKVPD